uniref:Uncharacterized protein n=1 Tax=Onchocerca volvulus TaxID=6282 RepID=A0A8R1TX29_ONCVO
MEEITTKLIPLRGNLQFISKNVNDPTNNGIKVVLRCTQFQEQSFEFLAPICMMFNPLPFLKQFGSSTFEHMRSETRRHFINYSGSKWSEILASIALQLYIKLAKVKSQMIQSIFMRWLTKIK